MSFTLPAAIDLVDRAKENGRLAHAYLITGPVGSGKESLAIRMVGIANEGVDAAANSLEDLRNSWVSVIGPESKSRRISVKAVRAVEHTLQMAAPAEVTKFAIVADADRMGIEAENAFLKTLEEPPEGSRLLLLSSRPEMLLETILSRCIRIDLAGKPGPAELDDATRKFLDALRESGPSGSVGISGALGLMAKFSSILKSEKSEIASRNEASLKEEVAHYRQTTEGNYLKQREEYYKALTEAEYLERRNRLIDFLMMWFGDAMRQQSEGKHLDLPEYAAATRYLAESLTTDDLSCRVEAVEKLRSNLNTNVFEALALEVGFIRAFA